MIDINMTLAFGCTLLGMAITLVIEQLAQRDLKQQLVTQKALIIRSK